MPRSHLAWPLALGAGALAGVALPPLGLPPLLWLALALLWRLADPTLRPRRLLLLGGCWGLAAVLVSHRWLLWLHPLDWVGVPAPLSLPLCLLLWFSCALLGGLLVGAWTLLMARLGPQRLATALIGAAGWGLAEVGLARGPLFWIGLGGSALPADRPLAGLASLGGAALVAAVQLLLGWALAQASRQPRRAAPWARLLALVLASHLLGQAALATVAPDSGRREAVRVLQPAIPTRRKFQLPEQLRLLQLLAQAQRLAGASPGITLLLPEGALPLGQTLPETTDAEVITGGFRQEGSSLRSSLLRHGPGQQAPSTWVDKHRLVPLGEWLPLADLWRWGGLSAVGGLQPAAEASRLLARPNGAVAVAICYELADGTALARASREGARWLLASANLDPYPPLLHQQFIALARLRAIETGRWLVSAANTGPSLVVDAQGQVRQLLPPGPQLSAVLPVAQRQQLTAYDRWGETPVLLLLAAGVVARRWPPSHLLHPPG